jgi:hypothetical protein
MLGAEHPHPVPASREHPSPGGRGRKEEASMNWNKWIRQSHRWVSAVFMVTVVVTAVALAMAKPAAWVSYLPLPPLFLLMFTGVYLFVLPYAAKWRSSNARRAPE